MKVGHGVLLKLLKFSLFIMKLKHIILVLFSSVLFFFSTGCVVTAITGMPPPAALEVMNSVEGTVVVFTTNRDKTARTLKAGELHNIPVCDMPTGSRIAVTGIFYDAQSNKRLGYLIIERSIWFDGGYRYSDSAVFDHYIPFREQSRN